MPYNCSSNSHPDHPPECNCLSHEAQGNTILTDNEIIQTTAAPEPADDAFAQFYFCRTLNSRLDETFHDNLKTTTMLLIAEKDIGY